MALRVDYEQHGRTYTRFRRPDHRIAERIERALGDARTVVNVGAGAGSYEPRDRWVLAIERPRFPSMERIADVLGGRARIERIPTPGDCADGFFEAFWRRPETLLDPEVRASQSIWTLLEPGVEQRIVDRLRGDLASGAWDAQYGYLRDLTSYEGALRLVVGEPA
jgi:hypothetical protein